jgi:inosine-uridine nucleoside N-ribohydrolase
MQCRALGNGANYETHWPATVPTTRIGIGHRRSASVSVTSDTAALLRPRTLGAPLILDTDTGGDPDDAIAMTCAAREPDLALVITADEVGGKRARFARYLLDLLGRRDVSVVVGADLGNDRYWVCDDLTPEVVAAQPDNVVAAVLAVCAVADGPVRWVGCGPLTNLARILRAAPELAEQLAITQMGGAINYRDPARAEHNFRLDPDAARFVVTTAPNLSLVMSDTTFVDEIAIDARSDFYTNLAEPDAPAWAALLARHLERWFDLRHSSTKQHDPLTLTAALQLPFVSFNLQPVSLAPDARMRLDPAGRPVLLSAGADYAAFRGWLATQLAHDGRS